MKTIFGIFPALILLFWHPLYAQAEKLSDEEIKGIRFMAEEEKMARDIYLEFEQWYDLPVFRNIGKAESFHMQMMSDLAGQFGITLSDSFLSDAPGEYQNEDLTAMYNKLTDQGETSLTEALRAGALIEEADISDLQERMENTQNQEIRDVYSRLIMASGNHLRAFVNNLEFRGIDYKPSILSKEAFNEIMTRNKK